MRILINDKKEQLGYIFAKALLIVLETELYFKIRF